ncbi:MAG TPA: DUF2939 domain-containing protein [Pyrinomonadaceae bacterium]|jgi:hypothetical protein
MSHFVVNLSDPEKSKEEPTTAANDAGGANPYAQAGATVTESAAAPNEAGKPKRRGGCGKILGISAIVVALLFLVTATVGYFYWQSVKLSPEYSLALLVDAARRGDQKAIDELVDTDAVVESFLPQVTDKATELYGRNLPADKIAKVKTAALPLMPAIKQRARSEVPRVIQEKTDKFVQIPYWAIALGAGYYLDVKPSGDAATITSKIPERQFELAMKRNGDRWRVTGIKDEALAKRIAETIGQELIAISTREGLKKASERMNAPGLENIKKKIDELFK